MIVSVSRRTDVPALYSDWLFNRIRAGWAEARNPRTKAAIRVSLLQEDVDGIVFWTKNPAPMLERLHELKAYAYYFQFTLTPYGSDVEPNVLDKMEAVIPTFKALSEAVGADRVIWRCDPIMVSPKYSLEYHVRAFAKIAKELHQHTQKVIISFIDQQYHSVGARLKHLNPVEITEYLQFSIALQLAPIAKDRGMQIETCAETTDLSQFGIGHARCVDKDLFERMLNRPLNVGKDRGQRSYCGCATSIDIGTYNTCTNGCLYCYANTSARTVERNRGRYDPMLPHLC